MSKFETLTIDDAGTQFAFLDSGIPEATADSYATIFVVHGIVFTSPIFQKVIDLAPKANLRIVAINRRDYPGSTPLSPKHLASISGSDEAKAAYLCDRGLEYLYFVDRFIEVKALPAISEDGKSGGVALLGWSLGASFTTAALASTSRLDIESKERLRKHLKTIILQDPPHLALGFPMPPELWAPLFNQSIPEKERLAVIIQWLTGYFTHGDLSKRDASLLTSVAPCSSVVSTVYSLHAHLKDIVFPDALNGSDGLLIAHLGPQLHANYLKAYFSQEIRDIFPNLNVVEFSGDMTGPFCISALWQIQDDDAKHGGGRITFEVVPRTNHFIQWDYPERTIEIYQRSVTSTG